MNNRKLILVRCALLPTWAIASLASCGALENVDGADALSDPERRDVKVVDAGEKIQSLGIAASYRYTVIGESGLEVWLLSGDGREIGHVVGHTLGSGFTAQVELRDRKKIQFDVEESEIAIVSDGKRRQFDDTDGNVEARIPEKFSDHYKVFVDVAQNALDEGDTAYCSCQNQHLVAQYDTALCSGGRQCFYEGTQKDWWRFCAWGAHACESSYCAYLNPCH